MTSSATSGSSSLETKPSVKKFIKEKMLINPEGLYQINTLTTEI